MAQDTQALPQGRFEVSESPGNNDQIMTLSLRGQLDAHTAPEFERFLEERVRDQGKTKVILDFNDLDYISSAGLGVLMGLIEEIRAAGGDMKLARLPDKIFHVLDLLGFPLVFEIFKTLDEARAKFTS